MFCVLGERGLRNTCRWSAGERLLNSVLKLGCPSGTVSHTKAAGWDNQLGQQLVQRFPSSSSRTWLGATAKTCGSNPHSPQRHRSTNHCLCVKINSGRCQKLYKSKNMCAVRQQKVWSISDSPNLSKFHFQEHYLHGCAVIHRICNQTRPQTATIHLLSWTPSKIVIHVGSSWFDWLVTASHGILSSQNWRCNLALPRPLSHPLHVCIGLLRPAV